MPKTDDELFNEAYTVFQNFFQICVENRQEEFHAKIGTAARQMRASDFLFARLALDKEHAKNIGEDFFAMYDTYINPKCGLISKNAEGILYGRLSVLYRGLGNNAEKSIQSIYARQVWDIEKSKSETIVSSGHYNNANSKYQKLLNAKIEEHNFEIRRNKESERNITDKTNVGKSVPTKTIDQDDGIDKFVNECVRLKLKKGKTIPPDVYYEIGKKIFHKKMPSRKKFKDGERMYGILHVYGSLKGYKKSRESKT